MSQNCWENLECGREEGGANIGSLGVCPASTFTKANGFAGGKNGGRGCAYITGTYCSGEIQGAYRDKLKECVDCGFYNMVKKENPKELNVISFNNFIADK